MTRQATLLASWRAVSTQGQDRTGWHDAEQWWTPAVDELVDALVADRSVAGVASEALGRQRAAAGVFLDSARQDLRNAAVVAGCSPAVTAELLDALTLGWVDHMLDGYFANSCLDPLTELVSSQYLVTRLAEIYAEAQLTGNDPTKDYALVIVQAAERSDPIEAATQLITAQIAMRLAFPGGETLARVGPRCGLVLCRREQPRFGQSLAILEGELSLARAERRLPGVRMWIEALPPDPYHLSALLRDISFTGD